MHEFESTDELVEMNFGDVVDRWATVAPTRGALVAIDTNGTVHRWTYADVARSSSEIAAALSAVGVSAGDRVLVVLPRGERWHSTMVACLRIGAVAVPCITMLTAADLAHRVAGSGASCIVTTEELTGRVAGVEVAKRLVAIGDAPPSWRSLDQLASPLGRAGNVSVAAVDPAVIYYTSGSTGAPKGVTLSARNLCAWRTVAEHWLCLGPEDLIWCTADTGWSKAGCSALFGPWSCGATAVVHDGPFDPRRRLEILEQLGVTVYCAPATELRLVLTEDVEAFDLSALRLVASAGESVGPDLLSEWTSRTNTPLFEGYGQTENLMTVANRLGQPIKPGSMGTALPGVDMAVVTDDDRVRYRAAVGQLVLRCPSPQLMLGYWGDPEATAAVHRRIDDADWFLTGDRAAIDDDGYLTFVGRTDDVIGSSGYRIGPQEVEDALRSHPAVVDVAVVGHPDPLRGEVVRAFVVLAAESTPSAQLVADLQRHARAATAAYKYPRLVEFIDMVPRTPSGKVRRDQLRSRPAQVPT